MKIAIAIPLKSFSSIYDKLKEAILKKADLIEIRFDYLNTLKDYLVNSKNISNQEKFNEITSHFITRADLVKVINLCHINGIAIIFTLRRKDQGGMLEISEDLRIQLINYLIEHSPDFLDIESDTPQTVIFKIHENAKKKGTALIYSDHNWTETPSIEQIIAIIEKIIKNCPELNPKGEQKSRNVIKTIFTTKKESDNVKLGKICETYSKNYNIVCFGMGALGTKSRLDSLHHGAFFSFASLDQTTAPGQLSIEKFRQRLTEYNNNQ